MNRSFLPRSPRASVCEQLERRDLLTYGWGLDALDASDVWDKGYTGDGVVVAVIDSGIDFHRDLVSSVWVNRGEMLNGKDDDGNGYADDLNGWNFVDDDNSPISPSDHGTHMSGTIAAGRNGYGSTGVAYDATVMSLRVFNEAGVATTSDISSAIRYAVDNGAQVINLSVGGTSTRHMTTALQHAADNNVLVVAAAGNETAATPVFPAVHSAELNNIISVGAHTESYYRLPTSNRVGNSGAIQVDAPGEHIYNTVSDNEYARTSGTSVAAAHVAGVAALAISAYPDVAVDELRDAIVEGATRRVSNSDAVGAVNALRTVDILLQSAPAAVQRDADFDDDGEVGFDDFIVLARYFGQTQNVSHSRGDANGDGRVEFSDFIVLAQTYGKPMEQAASRRGRDTLAVASDTQPGDAVPVETGSNPAGPAESTAGTGAGSNAGSSPSGPLVDVAINEIVDEEPLAPVTDDDADLLANMLLSLFTSSQ